MRLFQGFPLLLMAIGLFARVAPLLDVYGRSLRQFTTEDGYLMLTIARNVALGHGMSIADGTIPTNGTQPLMSYVYAVGFWLVGGNKEWGVWIAQAIQIAIAIAAAVALYGVGRRTLEGLPGAETTAALVAASWFASSRTVAHTQNGLETGAYVLVLLCLAAVYLRLPSGATPWPFHLCIALGALLGSAFWIRNDASLIVFAVCICRVLPAVVERSAHGLWRRLLEAAAIGATAVVVALPWLVNNKVRFGHLRPISGVAEGTGYIVGQNLIHLPVALAEHALIVLPIPRAIEEHPLVLASSLVVAALSLIGGISLARRLDPAGRRLFGVLGAALAVFIGFYGFTFGVGFFLGRYFFPFSPFLALVTVFWVRQWLSTPARSRILLATTIAATLLVVATNVRLYRNGMNQGHFQVVDWVLDNVPSDTWVGAIQTGTLGFFHDRTINLDGKVNPRALDARLHGRTQEYVLETDIQYLVDWVGIDGWLGLPALRDRFSLVVRDPEQNLAVLVRQPPT